MIRCRSCPASECGGHDCGDTTAEGASDDGRDHDDEFVQPMSLFPTPENSPRSWHSQGEVSGSERSKLSARTRLSSQAAPFQPQIAAATAGPAGRGHSTAFYAVPSTRYVRTPSVPSVPSVTAQQCSYPATWSWDEAADPKVPPVILGSDMLPSLGSGGHATGECKPCAFFFKKSGCASGRTCLFCHLCENGEKKRRQREKKDGFVKPGQPGPQLQSLTLSGLSAARSASAR